MKRTILIIGLLFMMMGCSNDDDGRSNEIQIQVKNASSFDFMDVVVNTSGGENTYSTIVANQSSGFQTFDFAYRYAFVELKINGETYTIQPMNYDGEERLDPRERYVYVIRANGNNTRFERLSMTLEVSFSNNNLNLK